LQNVAAKLVSDKLTVPNSLDAEEIAEECSRRCKHFVGAFAPKVRSLELGKADGGKRDAKRFI
jgi:hypothetical protein